MGINKNIASVLFFLSCGVLVTNAQKLKINAFKYAITKNIICKNGAVVSAHALASQVGVSILQQGGNAIDAAIAMQLTLAVVYPDAGNIGGGGFMVAHLNRANEPLWRDIFESLT